MANSWPLKVNKEFQFLLQIKKRVVRPSLRKSIQSTENWFESKSFDDSWKFEMKLFLDAKKLWASHKNYFFVTHESWVIQMTRNEWQALESYANMIKLSFKVESAIMNGPYFWKTS